MTTTHSVVMKISVSVMVIFRNRSDSVNAVPNTVTVTGMTVTAVTNFILLPHCAITIALLSPSIIGL